MLPTIKVTMAGWSFVLCLASRQAAGVATSVSEAALVERVKQLAEQAKKEGSGGGEVGGGSGEVVEGLRRELKSKAEAVSAASVLEGVGRRVVGLT